MKAQALFIFLLLVSGVAFAKRAPAPKVAPVTVGAVEFRAVNSPESPGGLVVWDVKANKELKAVEVYKITYVEGLEKDVQWVFITKLILAGDKLYVLNEKNDLYTVDTKTYAAAKVTDAAEKEKILKPAASQPGKN